MIKAGDLLKNIENGRVFAVKSIGSATVLLTTKDGYHSMFVNPNSIESAFLPFVEEEPKRKLK